MLAFATTGSAMTTLTWSDTLSLEHPTMDATHVAFVALLAEADDALPGPEAALLAAFDRLVAMKGSQVESRDASPTLSLCRCLCQLEARKSLSALVLGLGGEM